MYCKKCGNEMEPDAKFCKSCGTSSDTSYELVACKNCSSNRTAIVEESYRISIIKESINLALKVIGFILLAVGFVIALPEISELFNNESMDTFPETVSFALLISGIVIITINIIFNNVYKILLGSSRTKIVCLDCGKKEYIRYKDINLYK